MPHRFMPFVYHTMQNENNGVYHKMLSGVLVLFLSNYNTIRVRAGLLNSQHKKVHIGDYALGCFEFYIK